MYVACWYNNHDIRIEDRPRPVPNSGEILLKIMSCGICGSDVVEWYRLPRAPLIPGHEIGALVAVGASIKSYKPGDRLFVAPKVPCMKCNYCRKGLYAVCSSVKQRLPGGLAQDCGSPSGADQKRCLPSARRHLLRSKHFHRTVGLCV